MSRVVPARILPSESSVPADVERLFEGHPHFHAPGASIEVLEFIPMPAGQG